MVSLCLADGCGLVDRGRLEDEDGVLAGNDAGGLAFLQPEGRTDELGLTAETGNDVRRELDILGRLHLCVNCLRETVEASVIKRVLHAARQQFLLFFDVYTRLQFGSNFLERPVAFLGEFLNLAHYEYVVEFQDLADVAFLSALEVIEDRPAAAEARNRCLVRRYLDCFYLQLEALGLRLEVARLFREVAKIFEHFPHAVERGNVSANLQRIICDLNIAVGPGRHLNEMVAELCFDRSDDLVGWGAEGRVLEGVNHLSAAEPAEIATT